MAIIQIIGKGGLGREVASYIEARGISLMMFEYECEGIVPFYQTVIAIGDVEVKKRMAEKFSHLYFIELQFGSDYGKNEIGKGTIICPGTILTVNIKIGVHCLINLNCTIGHDVVIGDFVTISPGANISGNVTIGNECYIGTNAVIREKISICDNVVIGAGGVVVKNITEPGVYVGNPVKKV
jgi:sugar O-acyltransferase (sialic acid O-acetyltransferase NeuD family)